MKRIIKLDSGDPGQTVALDARPLDLADVSAEARRVLAQAHQESHSLVAQASQQALAIREDARKKGYADGQAQGREEGYVQGRQAAAAQTAQKDADELAQLTALLKKAAGELLAAKADVLHQARQQALGFAIELARKIVTHVCVHDTAAAEANLEKVLELADAAGEIVVKVNPGQLERLQHRCADLADSLHLRGAVRLSADERIAPGGVKLLTRNGELDATIQTQMDNIVRALTGDDGRPQTGGMASPAPGCGHVIAPLPKPLSLQGEDGPRGQVRVMQPCVPACGTAQGHPEPQESNLKEAQPPSHEPI